MANIHPSAIIDPSARLADDVEIGPYAIVGPDCELASGVVLHAQTRLASHVDLGEDVAVHSGAVIGDIPQHLAYKEHPGRVKIGARTVLREHVTVHRPFVEGGVTEVGQDCFLMVNSHVAHDCLLADRVVLVNAVLLGGHSKIGEKATLSGGVLIHQWCEVGRLAMVSGGAEISTDIPPFCTAVGRNFVSGLNVVGLRRSGMKSDERKVLKRVFLKAFQHDEQLSTGIKAALESLGSEPESSTGPAREFLDFLQREHPKGVARKRR